MAPLVSSVVCIADVHGVLPALEAVLAHPDVQQADLIVVCGDVAAGPQPVEVLDRLSAMGNVRFVRGNADRELAAIARGDQDLARAVAPIDVWAAAQLREDQIAFLESMPYPLEIEVPGFGPVTFCHGTPRSDDEVVLVDTRASKWDAALIGVPVGRTVVCGHTHMPFVRLASGRTVMNPGSVGMPYGAPGAYWGLLDGGTVSLRKETYDVEAAIEQVSRDSGFDGAREWAEEYLRATNSDADAMTAFGPMDGRDAG